MKKRNEQSKVKKRSIKKTETFREKVAKYHENDLKNSKPKIYNSKSRKLAKKFIETKPLKVLRWIFSKIIPRYFKDSFRELKLVTWPSWNESWRLTYAVLAFAVVFGAVVSLMDYGLEKIFKIILLQ